MEWSTEKPADPIELRVYPGADGDFTLYEDENDNYNYEKGKFATIPMHLDSEKSTLSIGDRKGDFPGMLKLRTFRVVFVHKDHGAGVVAADEVDRVVLYSGVKVEVRP
jgi:alpha-D-xyloside xylohydrolase